MLPLMLAAGATERVQLATGIVIAFPRSPMVTAQMSWDLQRYSGGRFALGLGSQVKGHNERRFSVPWSAPGPRMREYVLALRAIWRTWQEGEPLDFRGEHYTFTLMPPGLRPGVLPNGQIPVSIAAVNPYMLRLAGEVCDGVRLHHFCSRRYLHERIVPELRKGLAKSGRTLEQIDVSGGGFIVTGATEAEVARNLEETRRQIGFYGSTRTYSGPLDLYGWSETAARLHEMSLTNRWSEMTGLITDDMIRAFAVVGTYDELPARVAEHFGGVVNRLSLRLPLETRAQREAAADLIQRLKALIPVAA
jgi:probable F420-dependent oxidoreductase